MEMALEKPASKKLLYGVLVSSFLSWMFDAMDLQLFTLILIPSVRELLHTNDINRIVGMGGLIVAVKLIAWGIGGVVFGVITDRIGRAKTMIITVLVYSIFTGLSALAQTPWELAALQAIAGFGIGGEWAAGAALVAETWPESSRARALQVMQLSFAFGFFAAALLNLVLGPLGWRYVLVAGAAPAIVTIGLRLLIREPERWVRAKAQRTADDTSWKTFSAIFSKDYRRVTLVGVLIAVAMMVGSWGATTLIPAFMNHMLSPAQLQHAVVLISQAFMLINVGALVGYLVMMWAMVAVGRRWSYFFVCVGSAVATFTLFAFIHTLSAFMMFMPLWGFFAVGGYGTIAGYLPELYPTRFRATGQGFCWNVSRIVTGFGPAISGLLVGATGSVAHAGMVIPVIYLLGLAIWFGPETKNRSLAD